MSRTLALLVLLAAAPVAAQEAAPVAKVAVVVAGDPDAALREAARGLDELLAADSSLLLPGDPGVRHALRGEPAADPDDGLERLRAERRRLGWNDAEDGAVLSRLGRMTGTHLLLVVRRAPQIVVDAYDVSAGAFYEDRLDLGSVSPAETSAFVAPLARAALRRASEPPTAASAAARGPATAANPAASASDPGSTAPAPSAPSPAAAPAPETPRARRWVRKNWPYLVAGALLVGVVTGVTVSRRHDDPPPPVLRFLPGGND